MCASGAREESITVYTEFTCIRTTLFHAEISMDRVFERKEYTIAAIDVSEWQYYLDNLVKKLQPESIVCGRERERERESRPRRKDEIAQTHKQTDSVCACAVSDEGLKM